MFADLNIYTHRHYDSDKLLFEKFTDLTGIKINVIINLIKKINNRKMLAR